MACICAGRSRGLLRVTVRGRLTSRDMGRLEHACAPALIDHRPRLEVDLGRVTGLDDTAFAVVQQMASRGVRIIHPRGAAIRDPGLGPSTGK
jgi:hypothetical protein